MEGFPCAKPGRNSALIESIALIFHRQCLSISAIGFRYFVHRRRTTMNPYPITAMNGFACLKSLRLYPRPAEFGSVKRFAMKWGQGGVIGMVLVVGISPRNILPA